MANAGRAESARCGAPGRRSVLHLSGWRSRGGPSGPFVLCSAPARQVVYVNFQLAGSQTAIGFVDQTLLRRQRSDELDCAAMEYCEGASANTGRQRRPARAGQSGQDPA